MTDSETIEDLSIASSELRRAYAGAMTPDQASAVAATAIAHGLDHPRTLRRAANPIGYLYRAGLGHTRRPRRGFVRWNGDDSAPGVDEQLLRALSRLTPAEARAIWLVRACRWTNVQAGEALETSPIDVADVVKRAVQRLQAATGTTEIDDLLISLGSHRAALVPEAPEPDPDDDTADEQNDAESQVRPQPRHRRIRRAYSTTALAGVLILAIAGVLAWRLVGQGDSTTVALSTDTGSIAERDVVNRDDWAQPLADLEAPSTFALAQIGDAATVQVAVPQRALMPMGRPTYTPNLGLAQDKLWPDADLSVSTLDQLDLVALASEGLPPFTDATAAAVSAEARELDANTSEIRLFEGTSVTAGGRVILWLVGTVDGPAGRWVFAHNAEMITDAETEALSVDRRLGTVLDLLRSAGAISD